MYLDGKHISYVAILLTSFFFFALILSFVVPYASFLRLQPSNVNGYEGQYVAKIKLGRFVALSKLFKARYSYYTDDVVGSRRKKNNNKKKQA